MSDSWPVIVAILILLVLLGLGVVLVTRLGRGRGRHASPRRPSRSSFRRGAEEQPPPPKKRVAVVLNPTKFADVAAARELVKSTVLAHEGWDEPIILETTVEDTGVGQTRSALAQEVDLVCAIGGDGTVRAVAEVLTGTSVPMGLIPAGTGNLLGRNLGLPLDVAEGLEIALTGRNRHIDVGWATLDPDLEAEAAAEAAAAAGAAGAAAAGAAGAAAGTVQERGDATADEATAEGAAGAVDQTPHAGVETSSSAAAAEAAAGRRQPADDSASDNAKPSVEIDIAPEPTAAVAAEMTAATQSEATDHHAFLVMAGVGLDASIMHGTSEEAKARIGWGAYVATGAKNLLGARFATRLRIDGGDPITHTARTVVVGNCGRLTGGITLMPDAEVDDGILDVVAITPKGIVGWAGVAIHVLAKRGQNHPKLDRYRCQSILVSLDEPQLVEVDGDVVGRAKRVRFEVRPKSLIVRTDPSAPKPVTITED